MKTFQIVIALILLLIPARSPGYTEQPGERKGMFIRDPWGVTWFLRASAISVSDSVATQAAKWLRKPVVFNVTEFDHDYLPLEYRKGTIATDPVSEAASAAVSLSMIVNGNKLQIQLRNPGKEEWIVRDDVMFAVFAAPPRGPGPTGSPQPKHILLKQLITQESQPILKPGQTKDYEILLGDLKQKLQLPPGEYQILCTYFNASTEIRVASEFRKLTIP